ncbi:hypothetical protein VYU27_004934 [Nannochloropsis oceanica]
MQFWRRRRAFLVWIGNLFLSLRGDAFVPLAPRCPNVKQLQALGRLLAAASSTLPSVLLPAFRLSRSDAALEEFHIWLQTKGGLDLSASPLALRRIPFQENDPSRGTNATQITNLGLFTTSAIEKDQILLAIPESLVLTSELPSAALETLAEIAKLDHIGRLALRIVYEASRAHDSSSSLSSSSLSSSSKFENGGWLPYLRVLPSRDDLNLPFLWDEREEENENEGREEGEECQQNEGLLGLLAPSPLYDDIIEVRAEMRQELKSLRGACTQAIATTSTTTITTSRDDQHNDDEALSLHHVLLPLLTWQVWTWARAIAMSRPYVFQSDANAAFKTSICSSSSNENCSRTNATIYPLLRLIPLIDMANHDDRVHYAVQPGDGVFTSRKDIQLVADRAYPHANTQFLSTYGALSSASKFYSFGYLDTLPPPLSSFSPSSSSSYIISAKGVSCQMQPGLPAQGTALLVLSLDSNGNNKQEGGAAEKTERLLSYTRKAAVLASVGMKAQGQRVEISTRTSFNSSGPTLAQVTIEEVLEAEMEQKGELREGGGLERLRRYLRLKYLSEGDLDFLSSSSFATSTSSPSSPEKRLWTRLSLPVRKDVELAVALEVVSLCSPALQSVQDSLGRVCQRLLEGGRESEIDRHRLGLLQTLLHGEMLALRAVAELFMSEVEAN